MVRREFSLSLNHQTLALNPELNHERFTHRLFNAQVLIEAGR